MKNLLCLMFNLVRKEDFNRLKEYYDELMSQAQALSRSAAQTEATIELAMGQEKWNQAKEQYKQRCIH